MPDVITASFSPDGKYIVTASSDSTARVWDVSGKQIAKLKGHQADVNSASFSPDGKHIVTASNDHTARVWDLSGKQMAELKGHADRVHSANFSPDGNYIVTASFDNTARIWDMSGKTIAKLEGHTDNFYSASFSPDGKHIVTASRDKTARIWSFKTLKEQLSYGCQWLNDYLITHPRELQELDICQNKSNFAEAAIFLVKDGEKEAKADDIDDAVATFRQALQWNANLKFDPLVKAKEFANKGKAERLIAESEQLVLGNIKGAIAKLQQALELDHSLDFELQLKLKQLEVNAWVKKGDSSVNEGKIKEAIASYKEAQKLDPNVKIAAITLAFLCKKGTLANATKDVMFACEKAVDLDPYSGDILDHRGVARALTGDYKGAIEDFEEFIAQADDKEEKLKRQRWVDALHAGKNPFTKAELENLR